MAGLEPDTIGIGHPAAVVRYIDIGNEVLAASLVPIEAIGKLLNAVMGIRHSFVSRRLLMMSIPSEEMSVSDRYLWNPRQAGRSR